MSKAIFVFLFYVSSAFSANILYVAQMASPSHHIWNRALALGLVSKGHNLTYVGPIPDTTNATNFTHILLEGVLEAVDDNFDQSELINFSPLQIILMYKEYCVLTCQSYAKSQGLQRLLHYPENFKFDSIIFDITTGGCLYPLIHKFNYPPVIAVTPFLLPPHIANDFGNHLYPAYIPWYALPYTQDMNFLERVWNFLFTHADNFIKQQQNNDMDEIMKTVFGENVPSVQELEHHIGIVLANTDPVLNYPQPLAPNIIPVGGLHTREAGSLPQDLKKIVDNSENGVIIFSLGTNVRSDRIDKKTKEALLTAFSEIKETVIWKFESDIDNLPKNVKVRKFLPQNDILGHSNVKMFIGHGGALSTQEAIFHGVPMICVPFLIDQHINAKNIADRKLGVSLDFKKITPNYVLQKLREVLDNPVYAENMKRLSETFKDREETPLERGIFWIEYAMRHKGAHFLNTPTRILPFYVSSSLDVISFLILVPVLPLVLILKLVAKILAKKRTKVKKN